MKDNVTTYTQAAKRIGQKAELTRGILRGTVLIESYRTVYGRTEFLVKAATGEHEWVREDKLAFQK